MSHSARRSVPQYDLDIVTRIAEPSPALLESMSDDDRRALLEEGRRRRYKRSEHLARQGDSDEAVFVIVAGRVKISAVTESGDEIACMVEGPGSLIGYWEAVDRNGAGRVASVIALEPVETRVISAPTFCRFLRDHPDAALVLLRSTIRTLRLIDRRRSDDAAHNTTHRLARFILEQIDSRGPLPLARNSGELDVPLTQNELAGIVAASRAALVRALAVLRSQGLITTGRRRIVVTNLAALRRYVH
jgi:CRP-like cAMP-binding protein